MFNERHRKELAHYLSMLGFTAVDKGVYVRIFNTRIGPVILECQIKNSVEFITRSNHRTRTEKFNFSRNHRDLLRLIIDHTVLSHHTQEQIYRLENAAGTLV